MKDIYETGIVDLCASIRLTCGKFLTPIIYKYIQMMSNQDCHPTFLMTRLLGILNNKLIQ